jgi:hypothetical protein
VRPLALGGTYEYILYLFSASLVLAQYEYEYIRVLVLVFECLNEHRRSSSRLFAFVSVPNETLVTRGLELDEWVDLAHLGDMYVHAYSFMLQYMLHNRAAYSMP